MTISTPLSESISTGFPSLDRILGGGFRVGDLVALGGDVGSGKSAMALAIALRAARAAAARSGEPGSVDAVAADPARGAAFLTCEMRPERTLERIVAMEGRVSLDSLRSGELDPEAAERVAALAETLAREAPILQHFASGKGVEDIRQRIASLSSGAALIVVDNLQALPAGGHALDQELAAVVRELKASAVEEHAAVLLLVHSEVDRRPGAAERPALSDYGAANAVKQHADVVLGLFREEMYESARGIEGATELHVQKNRHGALGYVDLFFYKEWLRFEDMVEDHM